jgi:hypothetical protein
MKTTLTNAVPASATSADKKLKSKAFGMLKPDLIKIPKSPTCKQKKTPGGKQK